MTPEGIEGCSLIFSLGDDHWGHADVQLRRWQHCAHKDSLGQEPHIHKQHRYQTHMKHIWTEQYEMAMIQWYRNMQQNKKHQKRYGQTALDSCFFVKSPMAGEARRDGATQPAHPACVFQAFKRRDGPLLEWAAVQDGTLRTCCGTHSSPIGINNS